MRQFRSEDISGTNSFVADEVVQAFTTKRGPSNNSKLTLVQNPNNGSDVWHIQRNIRAKSSVALHQVRWTAYDDSEDDEVASDLKGSGLGTNFIKSLRQGDRIAVLARARVCSLSCDGKVDLTLSYFSIPDGPTIFRGLISNFIFQHEIVFCCSYLLCMVSFPARLLLWTLNAFSQKLPFTTTRPLNLLWTFHSGYPHDVSARCSPSTQHEAWTCTYPCNLLWDQFISRGSD